MSAPPSGAIPAGRSRAARPAPRPRTGSRPALAVVPDRHRAPGRAFVVLLLGVLGAGLVGLLVLNTAMQRSAFTLDALDRQAQALDVRRQVLDLRVDRLQSPEVLGRRATELGMVPMTTSVFLRLSDGEILGDPQAAVAGTGPQLVAPPPAPHAAPAGDRDGSGGAAAGGGGTTSGANQNPQNQDPQNQQNQGQSQTQAQDPLNQPQQPGRQQGER